MILNDSIVERLLSNPSSILLATHKDPDLDALGSVLSLQEALIAKGHTVSIWSLEYTCQEGHECLPHIDDMKRPCEPRQWDGLIVVDCPSLTRVPHWQSLASIPFVFRLCIDHHHDTDQAFTHTIIDQTVSSVGELLTRLFMQWQWPITPTMATHLYAAIVGDTGRFLHANTSAAVFKAAAHLLDCGADHRGVSLCLLEEKSNEYFDKLQWVLSNRIVTGSLVYCVCPLSSPIDPFCVVDVLRQIKGTQVALSLIERPSEIKVSIRSKTRPILSVAQAFGGGGHLLAAGITLNHASLEETVAPIVTALQTLLNEHTHD